jgi:peptidoglycan/LPS O-acetylase OafA/YrhL
LAPVVIGYLGSTAHPAPAPQETDVRIATGIVLTGIVLLASAILGIEPTLSFATGLAALVSGAIALAIAMEARDQAELRRPVLAPSERRR